MKSEAIFTGRMNRDLDPRYLKPNQYRYAKNARVGTSQEQNVGALESEASTASFTGSYSFPSGVNKCIGACADVKNSSIVYCWYNSNGNHRIFRWNPNTNVVTDILPTAWVVSVLGWTSTTRLWNMRIVETGTDQIMFFHAVQGIPMRINLGISTQRPGSYTLTMDDISVARKQPVFQPTFSYATDVSSPSSFIQNEYFQFQYRWIYENGEETPFSPFSTLAYPPQDGTDYNKIVVTFNSGPKGVSKVQIARRIGNGVSDTGTQNPTLYIFNTWTKGSNSDDTNYTVDFFNTEVLTAVALNVSAKLFEAVPQLVGNQEVVQSNQVIYGDITEGYDNITNANVVINLDYDDSGIGEFTTQDNAGSYKILVGNWQLPPVGARILLQKNGTIVSYEVASSTASAIGALIVSMVQQFGNTASYAAGVVTTNFNYTTDFVKCYWLPETYSKTGEIAYYNKNNASQAISGGYVKIEWNNVYINGIDKVNSTDFKLTEDCSGGTVKIFVSLTFTFPASAGFNLVLLDVSGATPILFKSYSIPAAITQTINETFFVEANALIGKTLAIAVEKTSGTTFDTSGNTHVLQIDLTQYGDLITQGFKSGSQHKFGLVYYDQYMRQCGVQAITKKYVPFPTQRDYPEYYNTYDIINEMGYIPVMDWEIKHLPPSWAYYYSWVYDGGNVQNYAQIVGVVSDITADSTATTIKISPDNFSIYKFLYSGFSVGDRVRILGGPVNWNNKLNDTTLCDMLNSYIEGTIESFSTTEIVISSQNSNMNIAVLNRYLIEIFALTNSDYYFEQTIYEIGNPTASNRYHKGPVQNQDPSNPTGVPAKGDFVGNTYFRLISNYVNATDMFVFLTESNSLSYQVESNYWNKGRPQIETPDQKQQRIKWMYRWSNQLLENTQVNGMSSFDAGNYGLLSARFGALVAMREIGYTLKMIQEMNYNTAFIGRKQLQNADGSTQLVVTDTLIGIVNPSEDMYGTKHPGSVVSNGRSVYWLDTIKGCVLRESGNQPFEISNYGMQKEWRDASVAINALGYEVLAGFDNQTEQYFITYKNTGTNQFTWSFFDPEQGSDEPGWVGAHDFQKTISSVITPIDMYGWVGQIFTSCVGANGYKHNVGSSYLQIYGEQKTMEIESAFILDPNQVTAFLAHWVRSNRVPYQTIFTIPAGAQTPYGMRSYLVQGNYSTKEDVFYSEIKRDGYTKGFYADDSTPFRVQMLEGRVMRGHVCLAKIQATGSTIFVLFSHAIADQYSPLS